MKNHAPKIVAVALGVLGIIGSSSCLIPAGAGSGSSSGSTSGSSSNLTGSSSGTTPTSTPIPTQVSFAVVAHQQMNLGTSISVPVTIQSQNNYSGPVTLSINNKVLAANDPMNTITVSVSPASVNVTAGGTASATVSIISSAASPDLDNAISVVATTPNGQVLGPVPFQVMAIYEVDILGPKGADEMWSVATGSTTLFTQHAAGITINFVNKYATEPTGTYRIHSDAVAFQHQETGGLGVPGQTTVPAATQGATSTAAASVTAGDTYTVKVTSQTAKLSDTFYDHNNENAGSAARKFTFNAYTTPPVIGQSGNPNASFAYINANVFTPMCMSCHSATNAPTLGGSIALATYAEVLGYVQAGSAAGSSLYIAVAPGGTMPMNAPGTVTAANVKNIQDWINDGAKNN